jgi:hypothetical protein
MAKKKRNTTPPNGKNAPPVTTILLVRHGQTPTTGQILPRQGTSRVRLR